MRAEQEDEDEKLEVREDREEKLKAFSYTLLNFLRFWVRHRNSEYSKVECKGCSEIRAACVSGWHLPFRTESS